MVVPVFALFFDFVKRFFFRAVKFVRLIFARFFYLQALQAEYSYRNQEAVLTI
jgi:hypothetical protein